MKCVMVIDQALPLGLIANTAAVLAASLGRNTPDLVGEDVLDGDGPVHRGITRATISLLKGDRQLIGRLRQQLAAEDPSDLYFVDFCQIAQQSKKYEDYQARLLAAPADELWYLGLAIYGPEKRVNHLTGSLGLLR